MSASWLVVLDSWPPADVPSAAAAWAGVMGGTKIDAAAALAGCTGIAADRVSETQAKKLAAALTASGCRAFAAGSNLVGRLPRPLTASRLQLADEGLQAQVALTGPPQVLAWSKIVLVLPAARSHTRTVGGGTKKTSVGIGTVALAATTGLGAGKVIKAIRGKGDAQPVDVQEHQRQLVEIVAVGPLRRFHAFADRLDYSVLGDERVQGKENFTVLLSKIATRTRPGLASDGVLSRFIRDRQLPALLQVDDNNGLAAVSRWLLLRGAMRRLAARSA